MIAHQSASRRSRRRDTTARTRPAIPAWGQIWRASLALLVLLTGFPLSTRGQRASHTVLPQRPSCEGCSLRIRVVATLGRDSTDGYLTNYPMWTAMDGRGRLFVTLQPPGDLVLMFDTTGRFLGRVGRKGRGPGEFLFPTMVLARPTGALVIWDFNAAQLTWLDPMHRFLRRVYQANPPVGILPDGRQLVVAAMRDRDRVGYPLHFYDDSGRPVASFGESGQYYDERERWRWSRTAMVGPRGTVWAAHQDRYRVEEWSSVPEQLRVFERTVPWMPPVNARSDGVHGDRPTAGIIGVSEDAQQRLWVFSRVASEQWREALGPPSISSRGRTSYPNRDQGRLFDTVVDVIELSSGRLLVSTRVRMHIRFTLRPGWVAAYREDAQGVPLLDIVELTVEEGTTRR